MKKARNLLEVYNHFHLKSGIWKLSHILTFHLNALNLYKQLFEGLLHDNKLIFILFRDL